MNKNYYINYIKELVLPLIGISDESILYTTRNISVDSANNDYYLDNQKYTRKFQNACFGTKNEIVLDMMTLNGDFNTYLVIPFNVSLTEGQFTLFGYLVYSLFYYLKENETDLFNNALIKEKINELILQKGLFAYILADNTFKNDWIDNLYKSIQHWSEKTYEGRNVCFGFLINPRSTGEVAGLVNTGIGNFVDFISEEYSAVFTDGISSMVEIDSQCNFIKYHSTLHQKDTMPDNYNNIQLPIRFAQIIYENVVEDKVGLFLLVNGDIIIAQKQKIAFVRRAGHWLNFSQPAFYSIIKEYVNNKSIDRIIPSIYCTALDVSFAHSGGLIAVVDTESDKWKSAIKSSKPLVTRADLLLDDDFKSFPKSLISLYKKEINKIEKRNNGEKDTIISGKTKDLAKRYNKRRYLLQILSEDRSFENIDRKLRADLSGLDGAIILDTSGKIIACGAIIANKAGSSGGGRGSAARTLSQYGGFAIKISTDGYIEAFVDEARIYSIK